jgi:putative phosphoesterase
MKVTKKLLVMSDLHLDHAEENADFDIFNSLIKKIKEKNADQLLIAGDLAGGAAPVINYLNRIEAETGTPILYIPGNHCIWTSSSTSEIQYELLKAHHSSLIDHPFSIGNDSVIIGDMGWYDYGFGENIAIPLDFEAGKRKYWSSEARFAKWKSSDKELNRWMLTKLETQFEKYKHKKVIFVNHFIAYKDFVAYGDTIWNYQNAYMGSQSLGELIDRYPNISHVIFGHTHRRYGTVDFGNKKIICNPLGYHFEWQSKNIEQEIESCMTIIEI